MEIEVNKRELFKQVPGWLTPAEAFALQRMARNREVLEVGVFKGRSTIALAATAESVLSLDHFKGDDFAGPTDPKVLKEQFLANLYASGLSSRVTLMEGPFQEHLTSLGGIARKFSLVFYDACHSKWAVEMITSWWLLNCSRACKLAIHDYDLEQEQYAESVAYLRWFMAANHRLDSRVVDRLLILSR